MSRHISRVLLGVAMACLVTGASPALLASHALAQRAECVMLNKGPHLAEAVAFVDAVLRRMDRRQRKRSPRLRSAELWRLAPLAPSAGCASGGSVLVAHPSRRGAPRRSSG